MGPVRVEDQETGVDWARAGELEKAVAMGQVLEGEVEMARVVELEKVKVEEKARDLEVVLDLERGGVMDWVGAEEMEVDPVPD